MSEMFKNFWLYYRIELKSINPFSIIDIPITAHIVSLLGRHNILASQDNLKSIIAGYKYVSERVTHHTSN